MTGYEKIKNMGIKEISKTFMIGNKKAEEIKGMSQQDMAKCEYLCPHHLPEFKHGKEFKCETMTIACTECLKEFLETKI